ncbi:DUF6402 family protein [Cupriavidus sp. BIS7]|uniref:DUF6402 family protein n=1 Tax=Cupriavidus sp. BIS7 TaxID=1217718 RepID=UPI00036F99C4|nr:DUF6402 family protein [Cupriavidus sp. BIS7]
MSIATSFLSPKSNRQGKVLSGNPMYLDEIPGAMDKMGWRVSAALMRRWFATKPAWAMSQAEKTRSDVTVLPVSRVENRLVTMEWLLGFESVLPAFDELCSTWDTDKGREELKKRLYRAGWAPGVSTKLGYGVTTAMQAETTCQVNFRAFGAYRDTFNDLFGAVNKGLFKLAVKGRTAESPISGREVFEVHKIGLYCRDTYDFDADWLVDSAVGLGVWSRDRCLSKSELAAYVGSPTALRAARFAGFVPARNVDFRRWQHARNEGGDFYVFSDVLWLEPHIDHVPLD